MPESTLLTYAQRIILGVPWGHWALMAGISLALSVVLQVKKTGPVYGVIAISLAVFVGMVLLDTAVVGRCLGVIPYEVGYDFSVRNLFHIPEKRHVDFYANIAVFIPFGFFLSEFLSIIKRFRPSLQLGLATTTAFVLSLSIECLQLVFHVGFSELTDLIMNTLGGFVGASLAVMGRSLMARCGKGKRSIAQQ